jgi:hypothetical protein
VYPTPPMTPRPPALVTAAASSGPAATFMPDDVGVSDKLEKFCFVCVYLQG